MHTVRRVLQRSHLVHAAPTATVLDVAALMSEARVGCIPVLEGEQPRRRVLRARPHDARRGRGQGSAHDARGLGDDARSDHGGLDDRVERCLEKMRSVGCRHLPVVADGRVIAMISMRDLLSDEIEEQVEEIRTLRAYLHQAQ